MIIRRILYLSKYKIYINIKKCNNMLSVSDVPVLDQDCSVKTLQGTD